MKAFFNEILCMYPNIETFTDELVNNILRVLCFSRNCEADQELLWHCIDLEQPNLLQV